MDSGNGQPAPAPLDEVSRRRLEALKIEVQPYCVRGGSRDSWRDDPILLTIRWMGRIKTTVAVAGTRELAVITNTILSEVMDWETADEFGEQFCADLAPDGYTGGWRITGPEIYCWMVAQGMGGPAPAEWNWAAKKVARPARDESPRGPMVDEGGAPF